MQVPVSPNETARLDALRQYQVLDTPRERAFDELVELAAQICEVPMAAINFIDVERQWTKSSVGAEMTQCARESSFCTHAVMSDDILLVPDTTRDERFRENPFVTGEPRVRFYAGMPLVTPEGLSVGSLCVVDTTPRQLQAAQLQALRVLGRQIVAQLELRPDFPCVCGTTSDVSSGVTHGAVPTQSRRQRLERNQRARQALRAQQRHNDVLLRLSLTAIIMMDTEGIITEWNPAAQTMFGYAREQVIGRELAEVIVPLSLRSRHNAAFARHLRTGESRILGQRIEVSALRADGSEFPVELAIARHDSEGEAPIFISFLRDISARKQNEADMQRAADTLEQRVVERTAQLSEANAQLQHKIVAHQRAEERLTATAQQLSGVLASISDAFIALDANWRFTYVNDQALQLMKKTRQQLLGREIWDGFPGANDSVLADELRRATRSGQQVTLESYVAPWKIWVEIHAYPSETGLSIYFQDISVRRANQFALEEAKREADAANAAKSEFLGRISHELRTPLNAILGFGQVLDRQHLTPIQCESVSYILKSGQHLLELINEVLDISRVEAGHVELNLEPLNLSEAIAQACALVRPLADARSIELRLPSDLDANGGGDAIYVCADAQRFAQVMINLLSNAIKYNFERGEVEISWRKEANDRVQIGVRDSGPGISSQNLPRLFVPFERGAATDSDVEGTGLGLALTLHLVEAMGGEIRVQSALGCGSTFVVELPRAQAPNQTVAVPKPSGETARALGENSQSYRVLCIEDNLSNLRLLEIAMALRPEISLVCAGNAHEGLRLARIHEPDLILLDLNLPDLHGSQVLNRLQQSAITRDIPVVIVSADATKEHIEQLLDTGAAGYLTKPLDMRVLLQTVDKVLALTPTN